MFTKTIFKSAQKDLALLDSIIKKQGNFMRQFYLAGGTALAIHLGHRISYDLDFFSKSDFVPQELLSMLHARDNCPNIKNVMINIGSLQLKCNTNISFFKYDYNLIELIDIHPIYKWLNLASIEDIALMKVTAISSRGHKKDFIDLYFALKHLNWNKQMLLEKLLFKYPDANIQHLLISLKWFEDADKDTSSLNMVHQVSWDAVKQFFINF